MLKLQSQWDERNELYAKGDELYAKGDELYAEVTKLQAEGDELQAEDDERYAEVDELYAEGYERYAEGTLIWLNAVIAEYGDIQITWTAESCIFKNGDVYKFPATENE